MKKKIQKRAKKTTKITNHKSKMTNNSYAGKMTCLDFPGRPWIQPQALDQWQQNANACDNKMTTNDTAKHKK